MLAGRGECLRYSGQKTTLWEDVFKLKWERWEWHLGRGGTRRFWCLAVPLWHVSGPKMEEVLVDQITEEMLRRCRSRWLEHWNTWAKGHGPRTWNEVIKVVREFLGKMALLDHALSHKRQNITRRNLNVIARVKARSVDQKKKGDAKQVQSWSHWQPSSGIKQAERLVIWLLQCIKS